MRLAVRTLVVSTVVLLAGCSDGGGDAAPSASASAKPAPSAAAATAAPSAAPTASAAATPPPPAAPRGDCPKNSAGPGTLDQPCVATGAARLMNAKWTGKIDDEKGPFFSVTNESAAPVLYGKIAVYFYDKDKKQLEVKNGSATKPYLICAGSNLFSGVMKPKEKATLTFSCVKKSHVPEGTKAIEGELISVGFADASEKKNEFYWANLDLAPDARPQGGVKK